MIISDPIYGTIEISDTHQHILSSRPLARLRNIRQLGFTPAVYTGTVHSRFEHTLGKTFVLMNLLNQFRIDDPLAQDKLIVASLLSEIGTYPLSHSTTWLFGDRLRMTKSDYARELSEYIINLKLTAKEKDLIWPLGPEGQIRLDMPAFRGFPDLTILRLAGDIDYALRDAHYSGRYANNFDYRYFQTLVDLESDDCQEELGECVRELYRSIYALNSVYGDPIRRFITLILARLSGFLIDQGDFDVERYRIPSEYVELDDDRFMADVSQATLRASSEGNSLARDMFDCVTQLRAFEILQQPLAQGFSGMTIPEIERKIARNNGVQDASRVVAITDNMPNAPKYVLFDRTFDCYNEAVRSEYFYQMTGLDRATNKTRMWDERFVFFTII